VNFLTNNAFLSDLEGDFSKNIIIKIGIACIILIIIYNIISALIFYDLSVNFNSLTILINSSIGIILGFVIYNIGLNLGKKIGEYAGISKVIFDFILITFSLFYNNYLYSLDKLFSPLIIIPGLDISQRLLRLISYYSSTRPFWFQFVYFLINLSVFIEIALISDFFYILGKEKENLNFKMTSVAYLISYVIRLIFYYLPFILLYLSSTLIENVFLLSSLQVISSLKISFIEQINPNYKPIREEYK